MSEIVNRKLNTFTAIELETPLFNKVKKDATMLIEDVIHISTFFQYSFQR